MPGRLMVVVGGQFGSEAKGAVAGELSRRESDHLAVRVAGPNAGHTVIGRMGEEWKLQQIPVAAVTNSEAQLAIAAGSEIEIGLLEKEIWELENAGYHVRNRLAVDQSATLIEARHQEQEIELKGSIGSTGKGVGAARASRVMRNAELYGGGVDTARLIDGFLRTGGNVLIEGTQGYGLGQSAGFYPKCTSSDCRAIDFLSMAGANPWVARDVEVWVVFRTFPIRVAGNSGPLQGELSWEDLGVEPEYTTVTKKVRRVGEFDVNLAVKALAANGTRRGTRVALTFMDYLVPEVANLTGFQMLKHPKVQEYIESFEELLDHKIDMVGTGPSAYTFRSDR